MNATGIIVEYNPFHNGHMYHINKSKDLTNADVMVAVMSGHFLQRGEPAIFDKWTRAKIALHSGVDVVFELPVVYATQSAQMFAYGAVSLLEQLHCVRSLCFGSELGNIQDLTAISTILLNEPPAFKQRLHKQLRQGVSYPKAMEQALNLTNRDLLSPCDNTFQANNTLGLMYLLALKQLNSSITPFTIKREIASYHQSTINDASIASATAIRKLLYAQDFSAIKSYVPNLTYSHIKNTYSSPVSLENFRDMIFSKLYDMEISNILAYIDVDQGLAERIKKFITNSDTVTELIGKIKCKGYTWSRIQRVLTHVLLDMKKHDLSTLEASPYARVLGFNKKGQHFLQQAKKSSSIPIISKWNKEIIPYARYDHMATRVYSLIEERMRTDSLSLGHLATRDFHQPPIRI